MLNRPRQIERTQQEYENKDRVEKRSARKDKGIFTEKLASEAEEAAEKREFSTVYKITKQFCGNNTNHNMPVKGKQGKVITTIEKGASCLKKVLNRPDPEEPADPPPCLDINTSPQA